MSCFGAIFSARGPTPKASLGPQTCHQAPLTKGQKAFLLTHFHLAKQRAKEAGWADLPTEEAPSFSKVCVKTPQRPLLLLPTFFPLPKMFYGQSINLASQNNGERLKFFLNAKKVLTTCNQSLSLSLTAAAAALRFKPRMEEQRKDGQRCQALKWVSS